jgi:glycine/sarcosine N-methyltransferase
MENSNNITNDTEAFYTSIAPYYDYIFPFKKPARDFTKELIQDDYTLLDAGCGTGNMSIALAPFCNKIDAFDIDSEMVQIAKKKSTNLSNVEFQSADLLKITENHTHNSYDLVFCYGNTLVHLLSFENISDFLEQVYQILKPGGKIALQILNYEYILNNQITELPIIDNEHITFIRKYKFTGKERVFQFNTNLTVKASGVVLKNRAPLYAIKPEELIKSMKEIGFVNIKGYSSFKQNPLSHDKMPLIVTAIKEIKLPDQS